jgi:opacity protein-like surface antigen
MIDASSELRWSVTMRRLLLVAVMCGAASFAQAADMPDYLRGSVSDGLTSARVNWQGYYVGGQVSYGSVTSKVPSGINSDLQTMYPLVPAPGAGYDWRLLEDAHGNATGYGAFAGYNSQWDDVVVGFEANYIHDGFRSVASSVGPVYAAGVLQSITNSSATVKLSDFGSLRVRGGYVMGCFLPYLFAGTGFGSQTVERAVSATPPPLVAGTSEASKTKLVFGYSVGAGIDVMLVGGLFVRAEYEYRRVTSDIESNINTVRAGLGYKF